MYPGRPPGFIPVLGRTIADVPKCLRTSLHSVLEFSRKGGETLLGHPDRPQSFERQGEIERGVRLRAPASRRDGVRVQECLHQRPGVLRILDAQVEKACMWK